MSIITFIRHGQGSFGGDDYDRLSPIGRLQAEETGIFLARRKWAVDHVYAGPMERQMDTAKIIMEQMGLTPKNRLRIFHEFEEYDNEAIFKAYLPGMTAADPGLSDQADRMLTDRKAFQKVFQKVMTRWVAGEDPVAGCEPWTEFKARVRSGIERLLAESGQGKKVLLVASGGPLSIIMQRVLTFSDQKALEVNWNVRNASISEFFYSQDRMTLSIFNSIAHLELKGNPDLITYR